MPYFLVKARLDMLMKKDYTEDLEQEILDGQKRLEKLHVFLLDQTSR